VLSAPEQVTAILVPNRHGYICLAVRQSGISTQYIYRELLKQIVSMFKTGETPIDPMITLEIVAFIVGAIDSRKQDGAWVDLDLSL
jgi:hypothetical protein